MARRRRVNRYLKEERERKYRLRGRGTASKFIPAPDSDFARMARSFANHVAEHAERFSISPEQVGKLNASVEEFRDALYLTMVNDSAGPKATSRKNTARAEAEKIVRAVARSLRGRGSEAITPTDRLMLNIGERPQRLKTRSCPQIAPVLRFVGATHGTASETRGGARHILEYGNDFDRASNAKPHGAARMELFAGLVPVGAPGGGAVPTHPNQLSGGSLWYLRSFSTSRFEAEFPYYDGTPMLVVHWGRWADARCGVGPFSATCVARVEGGSLPELVYVGANRPKWASVSRKVEPEQLVMLEGQYQSYQRVRIVPPAALEAKREVRQLEATSTI